MRHVIKYSLLIVSLCVFTTLIILINKERTFNKDLNHRYSKLITDNNYRKEAYNDIVYLSQYSHLFKEFAISRNKDIYIFIPQSSCSSCVIRLINDLKMNGTNFSELEFILEENDPYLRKEISAKGGIDCVSILPYLFKDFNFKDKIVLYNSNTSIFITYRPELYEHLISVL